MDLLKVIIDDVNELNLADNNVRIDRIKFLSSEYVKYKHKEKDVIFRQIFFAEKRKEILKELQKVLHSLNYVTGRSDTFLQNISNNIGKFDTFVAQIEPIDYNISEKLSKSDIESQFKLYPSITLYASLMKDHPEKVKRVILGLDTKSYIMRILLLKPTLETISKQNLLKKYKISSKIKGPFNLKKILDDIHKLSGKSTLLLHKSYNYHDYKNAAGLKLKMNDGLSEKFIEATTTIREVDHSSSLFSYVFNKGGRVTVIVEDIGSDMIKWNEVDLDVAISEDDNKKYNDLVERNILKFKREYEAEDKKLFSWNYDNILRLAQSNKFSKSALYSEIMKQVESFLKSSNSSRSRAKNVEDELSLSLSTIKLHLRILLDDELDRYANDPDILENVNKTNYNKTIQLYAITSTLEKLPSTVYAKMNLLYQS